MIGVGDNGHASPTMSADSVDTYLSPIVIQPDQCTDLALKPDYDEPLESPWTTYTSCPTGSKPWTSADGCGNVMKTELHGVERTQVEEVMHDEIWPSQVPAASHTQSCSPDGAEPRSLPVVSQRGQCTDVILGSVHVEASSLGQSTCCGPSRVISWTITGGKLVRTDQVDEGGVEGELLNDERLPNQVPNDLYTEPRNAANCDVFNTLVPTYGPCDFKRSPISRDDSPVVCNTNLNSSSGQSVKIETMTGEATAIDDVSNDPIHPATVVTHQEVNTKTFFRCSLCSAGFFLRASLDHHFLVYHAQQRHICNICSASYLRGKRLEAHIKKAHGTCQCKTCGETFGQHSQLQGHMLDIHGKKHVCSVCSESFLDPKELRFHMKIHSGDKPFTCEVCSTAFASGDQLTQHLTIDHGKRFACSVCPATYVYLTGLRKHMKLHPGDKSYVCRYCSETFPSLYSWDKHRASITGKNASRSISRVHRITHTGEKPCNCELCDASYHSSYQSTCVNHMARHSFRCEVCSKGFLTPSLLRIHMDKHAVEKPRSDNVRRGHSAELPESLSPRVRITRAREPSRKRVKPTYCCSYCSRSFSTKVTLNRHVSKSHRGIKPFKCNLCPAAFVSGYYLTKHVVLHTGNKNACPVESHLDTHIDKRGVRKRKRPLRKEERGSTTRGPSDAMSDARIEGRGKLVETELCEGESVGVQEKMADEQCSSQVYCTASLAHSCNPESDSDNALSDDATDDLPFTRLYGNSATDVCSAVFNVEPTLKLVTTADEVAPDCDDVTMDSVHPSTANHDGGVVAKQSHICGSPRCEVCSKGILSQSLLRTHMDKHAVEKPRSDNVRVCPSAQPAESLSPTVRIRRLDMTVGVAGKVYLIQTNDARSTEDPSSTNFSAREPSRKRVKPTYCCSYCSRRSFSTKVTLNRHVRKSHRGIKPFKCNLCPAAFVSGYYLTKHVVLHTGNKNACPVESHLDTHIDKRGVRKRKRPLRKEERGSTTRGPSDAMSDARIEGRGKLVETELCKGESVGVQEKMADEQCSSQVYCTASLTHSCNPESDSDNALSDDATDDMPLTRLYGNSATDVCSAIFNVEPTLKLMTTADEVAPDCDDVTMDSVHPSTANHDGGVVAKQSHGCGSPRCEVCSKGILSQSLLRTHMDKHAVEKPRSDNVRVCPSAQPAESLSPTVRIRRLDMTVGVAGKVYLILTNDARSTEDSSSTNFSAREPSRKRVKPKYCCSYCSRYFPTQVLLDMHVRKSHRGAKLFKCNLCPAAFVSAYYLTKHVVRHAGNKNDCRVESHLETPIAKRGVRKGKRPLRKEMGESTTARPSDVMPGARIECRGKLVETELCEGESVGVQEKMADEQCSSQVYCTASLTHSCNPESDSDNALSDDATDDMPLTRLYGNSATDVCSAIFNVESTLKLVTTADEVAPDCDDVSMDSVQPSTANHDGGVVAKESHICGSPRCEVCSKGFLSQRVLRTHMDKHAVEKPRSDNDRVCPFAQPAEALSPTVRIRRLDMTVGVAGKVYLIQTNDARSTEDSSSTNVTAREPSRKPARPRYCCSSCSRSFPLKVLLDRHVSKSHREAKPFKCNICPEAFVSVYFLDKHVVLHTGNKKACPVECNLETRIAKRSVRKSKWLLRKEMGESTTGGPSDVMPGARIEGRGKLVETELCEGESVGIQEKMADEQCSSQVYSTASLTHDYNPESDSDNALSDDATDDLPLARLCGNSATDVRSANPIFNVGQTLKLVTTADEVGPGCDDVTMDSVHPSTANHDGGVVAKESHICGSPRCDVCSKGFLTQSLLRTHMDEHAVEKPRSDNVRRCHSAELPDSLSPTVRIRRLDMRVGVAGKVYPIQTTDARSTEDCSSTDVSAAAKCAHEPSKKLVEPKYYCSYCSKLFLMKVTLVRHVITTHRQVEHV